MRKWLFRVALFLGILYLILLLIPNLLQRSLIFQSVSLPLDHQYNFDYPFQEKFLEMEDKSRVNYLVFEPRDSSKGVVLYFHGNAGNLDRWGKMHKDFTSRGYTFWVMDYPGYGKSGGSPSEQAMYDMAKLFYQKLLETYKEKELIIYGRSLGSAVASYLASKTEAQQLILETPFNNMETVFKSKIPVPIALNLDYKFPNDEHIHWIEFPITIFHGTKDKVVPYESATQLKKELKVSDQFITIKGGGHKNLRTYKQYQEALDKIL